MQKELTTAILPNGSLTLEWHDLEEPVSRDQQILQDEVIQRFEDHDHGWLLFLGFSDPAISLCESLAFWRRVAGTFTDRLIKTEDLETLRHKVTVTLTPDEARVFLETAPFMPGAAYLTQEVIQEIWSQLNGAFRKQIKAHTGTVATFVQTLSARVHLVGRVFFHLVESKKEAYPFAFMATYSTGLNTRGESRHLPLKHALTEFGANSRKMLDLLSTVYRAAKESPFISDILASGEIFHPLALHANEAYGILKEVTLYETAGILCRIPNWWKHRTAGVHLTLNIGERPPTSLGLDSLLDCQAGLRLGEDEVTEEEVRRILAESEGLAFLKGKWVEVDRDRLAQTLHAYEQAHTLMQAGQLTLREAMRLQLGGHQMTATQTDADTEVSHGQWLQSVMDKLRHPEQIHRVSLPANFGAKLRPYQQTGLNWLCFLNTLQLGSCLADDMGLGKTIQMLAMLSTLKAATPGKSSKKQGVPSLLVLPASLLGNWSDEIQRFAPSLRFVVAHASGPLDRKTLQTGPVLKDTDLVITTYALCQKYAWLQSQTWNLVILDEAQAIKNPGTKQTRAVKKLKARNRIVLTGTPIENRLSDLWSLFDFLNPGLLGTASEFSKFAKALKDNPTGYARLKKIIGPYILRRLKTDKTVIADLPDKVEIKTYAELSKKQIVLYRQLVEQLKDTLEEESTDIQRKGLVLASLMKFKQLCNHPDQYLGQGAFAEDHSGKFQRLRSLCETIHEKREKVLIFTQFREIIDPLHTFLTSLFGSDGLVLHGGTAVKKRRDIVSKFQTDPAIPFMVLSLKAGGVGLNLTAASHVIHFDRWWNPAVENQATDRAYRIGQHKNVVVHKFITQGTLEEKIDKLLEDKAELSRRIVPTAQEQWVTEMNNQELLELFTLSL
ncbi:MAG: DEAD/DEAH box helicase [Phycisphaerae bacterium]|nr:DEAD/DEAH box helicase [Phycisphaerae bacterium]